ncbi:Gfo/Idh/MocA family oxidoreductase [Pseudomonas sp. HN11]|uniref:Gfo/Idh/MocA family oxidoreductase n=1 Tax=Pseudomonas sp. HN11 TaxID=1344094 RepID=UPI001F1D15A1|nr:Gfo/Idh/MocA family oxidoreductase [Pseudomonas sp. HN11]UII69865.1 Gfo/Idh/MocA family oxidoreductase [Pseudomonas sp. HN11]
MTDSNMGARVRIALVGLGAFGRKHLDVLANIETVVVTALVGIDPAQNQLLAAHYGIDRTYRDLDSALADVNIDALILCTPTPLHASQAIRCLEAGKHVLVEIPMADNLQDAERLLQVSAKSPCVAMVGHTRRFNPSHQWLHQQIGEDRLRLQHLVVSTHFMRRENLNAEGQPRQWTDSLLWHHAAHTVDLFQYQTNSEVVAWNVLEGPLDSQLGIAMDLSLQLKSSNGALCSLSLSFNNEGPFGSHFRFIGDRGTYLARYDELSDGYGVPVDLSSTGLYADGIELQDREFVDAIRNDREPRSSVSSVMNCYRLLGAIQDSMPDRIGFTPPMDRGSY